jgi:hypothetical protein
MARVQAEKVNQPRKEWAYGWRPGIGGADASGRLLGTDCPQVLMNALIVRVDFSGNPTHELRYRSV